MTKLQSSKLILFHTLLELCQCGFCFQSIQSLRLSSQTRQKPTELFILVAPSKIQHKSNVFEMDFVASLDFVWLSCPKKIQTSAKKIKNNTCIKKMASLSRNQHPSTSQQVAEERKNSTMCFMWGRRLGTRR